jgi:hypothetical protein
MTNRAPVPSRSTIAAAGAADESPPELARRDDVRDGGHRHRAQAAAAEALHEAGGEQLVHGLGRTAGHRAHQEDAHGTTTPATASW